MSFTNVGMSNDKVKENPLARKTKVSSAVRSEESGSAFSRMAYSAEPIDATFETCGDGERDVPPADGK